MANGDVIRCSIQGQQNGTVTVNTWHYVDRSGGSHVFDAATGASDFYAFMGGFLEAPHTTDWNVNFTRFAVIAGPNVGKVGYDVLGSGGSGGITPAQPAPPEVCAALKRWTGYAARSQRGRLFFGPLDSTLFANMEQGLIDDTNPSLLDLCHAMSATFTTGGVGLTPVLVGKAPTFTPTAAAINYTAIAVGSVHRKSRRQPGYPV